jgi:hypothetical protein
VSETTPPGGGPPKHLRLMLDRFRRGCEVCGAMDWLATGRGSFGFDCGSCGNVFDVPVIEAPSDSTEDRDDEC